MTPKIQLDFSSVDPRMRIGIIAGIVIILVAAAWLIFFRPGGEEVAEITLTPSTSPSPSPSSLPSPQGPPTETPTQGPTATLEPYSYVVQAGDTLYFIIQQFGYRDTSVVPAVIALNGMANENDLIAGETLFIPRPTPTTGPTFTASPTLDPLITPSPTGTPGPTVDPNITVEYTDCTPEKRCISPDGQFWIHIVRPGDTVAAIAFQYDTRVNCILQENGLPPEPIIFEGQQIKVCILVTQTPTLTPTGGPDSTATPTPTPSAPSLLAPAQNASIPRSQNVTLQWTTIRPLEEGQIYLVVLRNTSSGEEVRATTRANAYRLPDSLRPGAGRSAQFEWRVVVVEGSTSEAPIISGPGEPRAFTWGS